MSKKEKDNMNEDDEQKKSQGFDEDEDFGLPGLDDTDEESSASHTPTEEETPSFSDTNQEESNSEYNSTEDTSYDYEAQSETSEENTDFNSSDYRDLDRKEKKNSAAVPIIITLLVLIVVAGVVVYFLFFRSAKPEPVVEKPVDTTTYVIEKPVVEPEPIEPDPEPQVGQVNILTERTQRSYVVVASFFDEDMAKDYADELAAEGMNPTIIPPFGKSKFNRVAIESFDTFAEATQRAMQVSGFKEEPWPLKY